MGLRKASSNTARSKELLALARRYAEKAQDLSEGDDKRTWLEHESKELIEEARGLTNEARQDLEKI